MTKRKAKRRARDDALLPKDTTPPLKRPRAMADKVPVSSVPRRSRRQLARASPCPVSPAQGSFAMTVPEEQNFSLDHFCIPDHYQEDLSHVMLPHGMIIDRIERMAVDICRDYGFNHGSGERLHMLCILKGGRTRREVPTIVARPTSPR